jgi:hypothetical protein
MNPDDADALMEEIIDKCQELIDESLFTKADILMEISENL